MFYTQAHLDALDEAIASGVLRVQYGDRSVEYRSMKDLKEAREHVAAALAADSGSSPARHLLPFTDKGL